MSLSADLSCLQSGAGEEREAAMASLEKQLICPICLEIFNKPVVILPCQHNLCRRCANELYQPSLFQARTTMLVSSGRFRCPSCRHEVVLDRHGVYGLQRNLLVENIIDVYKQEVCKSISISPPPPPPPLPPPEPPQATCADHEGEKVNIYCLSCRVPTCSLCKVFGAHQSCKVAPLADVFQQQKDELKEGLSALAEHRSKIQTVIDELNQMCSDLEEAYKAQKQTVSDQFDHINSILEEKRKSMTDVMSAEEEQKTGRAKALLRCYGDTVTANSKLLERAQSTMEDPDSVAFVQSSKGLIEKLIAANASCPTESLDPDDENLSHYKYNFSPQYRALMSLQFPRDEEDVPEESESESETEDTEDMEDTAPVQYIEPPSQTVKDSPLIIPPEPVLVRDRDKATEERPQLQQDRGDRGNSDGTELRHRGEGQVQTQREERTAERSPSPSVPGRSVTPEAVKEEGMTTLQANEAGSEASEAMPLQEDGKDEKSVLDEETDALLYPRWYNWGRASPTNENMQANGDDKLEDIDNPNNGSKQAEDVNQIVQQEDICTPQLDGQNGILGDQNLSEGTPQLPHLCPLPIVQPSVEEVQGMTDLPNVESLLSPINKELDEKCEAGGTEANPINLATEERQSAFENMQANGDDKLEDIDNPNNGSKQAKDVSQIVQQEDIRTPQLDGQNGIFGDQNLSEGLPQLLHHCQLFTIPPSLEEVQGMTDLPNVESLLSPINEELDEKCEAGGTEANPINLATEERQSAFENTEDITEHVAEEIAEEEKPHNSNDKTSSCGDDNEGLSETNPELEPKEEFVEEKVTEGATSDIEDAVENQEEAIESTAQYPVAETAGGVAVQAITLLFYLLAFLVILQRFWVYIGQYILI